MKPFTLLLYVAGIAGAAIAAAGFPHQFDLDHASPELVERFWSLNLPLFAFSVALALVAAVLYRRAYKRGRAAGAGPDGGGAAAGGASVVRDPILALDAIREEIRERILPPAGDGLGINSTEIDAIRDRVGVLLLERCLPFAESRHGLAERLGPGRFAEAFGAYAAGERYLNRAWSAGTDQHGPELAASLRTSLEHLDHASELMR